MLAALAALAALPALALAGCAASDAPTGIEGSVKGFIGGVIADEPRAALEGRRVLASGGTAADAATAVYFALAATYPAAASLGGGGLCLVSESETRKVEMLDFLPGRPASVPPDAAAPTAVPGNALGFFMLHSRYGKLAWTSHVIVGERLARFGAQTSRALARDVAAGAAKLAGDPAGRAPFMRPDGEPVREGDFVRQTDLARTLAVIRARGPGDFYRGAMASELARAVTTAGGSLTVADLRDYLPVWRPTIAIPVGSQLLHFPDAAVATGGTSILFAMLARRDAFEDAGEPGRAHLVAETAAMASAAVGRDHQAPRRKEGRYAPEIPGDYIDGLMADFRPDRHVPPAAAGAATMSTGGASASTGFVAVDRHGMAVACSVTMNAPFGVGRVAADMGMFMAAVPGQDNVAPVGAAILANARNGSFYFAAASGGAPATSASLPSVAARLLLQRSSLDAAVAAPRVSHAGATDVTHVEPELPEPVRAHLSSRGHNLAVTEALGRVNALYCEDSLPSRPNSCAVAKDPRGHGLAATAEE